jgi:type II secretory pathway predicted ATPase ExeA/ribosomal protein L40E
MVKKAVVILLCLASLLIAGFPALAETAEDLYNRAANKYFLGNNEAAIDLLQQSLEVDPNYTKAKTLLSEIKKEMDGPPTTLAPGIAPTNPLQKQIEELRKVIGRVRPFYQKVAPGKVPEPKKPTIISPLPEIFHEKPLFVPVTVGYTWKEILWIITALSTVLYLILRFTFYYIFKVIEKRSLQICSECKTSNRPQAEFCSKCGSRLKPWLGVTADQRKWYARFNWKKNPFALDIIPNLFTGYQTQVNTIFEKVYARTGHILVMGKKGVGKTTLLKWLATTLAREFHAVYIPRPSENFDELLQHLATSLKLKKKRGQKITLYDLETLATKNRKNILLLLDEAQEFSTSFEQPLRSLGDLNGINFVMAGLLEVREKIMRDSPSFYDRIVQQVTLDHLSLAETSELIEKRISDAGGTGLLPFTPEAVENVYKMSQGIPRLILKICDWVVTEAIHHNLDIIRVTATSNLPEDTLVPVEKGGKLKQ